MLKLLSIVGARPQFIKLAPLLQAISAHNRNGAQWVESTVLHTGQHYDRDMSDIFFEELEMPRADLNLGVGSGTHGQQTAKMLAGIEEALLIQKPDMLIIFGDTNSTLAGALAASKLQVPVAHVEAGLRSFNRRMPEEINRITADHLSDILLAPTQTAVDHLKHEGLGGKTVLTGDIMYDTVLRNVDLALRKTALPAGLQENGYYLATLHRAENTDDPQHLQDIMGQLNEIAANHFPILLPIHPRTAKCLENSLPDWIPHPRLRIVPPVGYLEMLRLVRSARLVFTDSGGLQKEVFFLNRPCITLREETEWVETLSAGGNVLTGADAGRIGRALTGWEEKLQHGQPDFSEQVHRHFGQGDAAQRILASILNFFD